MSKTKWTDTLLDRHRLIGDIVADPVAEILWKNPECDVIKDLKQISKDHKTPIHSSVTKLDTHTYLTEDEAKKLQDYFLETEKIGEQFTDEDKADFKLNAEIFDRYGYFITLLLFFKSLPTGYMCPKPAQVLHDTKLLEKFAARRVMETAQFVFAVNEPDWYKPGNKGLESIQKVRLMHAGMRIAILRKDHNGQKWDTAEMGVPINQEDLRLTNLLFSVAIIDGLDSMGVHLTWDERKAVYNTWCKIGLALGIHDDMIAETKVDGITQYNKILSRNISKENSSGPPLTDALLKAMDTITSADIPIKLLQFVCMYFVNNSNVWDSLGLHKPSWIARILNAFIHGLLGLPVWQWLFHHKRNNIFMNTINRMANKFLIMNFGIKDMMKKFPGKSPLEVFAKSILLQVRGRDLRAFENMSTSEREKEFFIQNKLFEAWDLGSFELDVDVDKL